jgi:hypothetical protein
MQTMKLTASVLWVVCAFITMATKCWAAEPGLPLASNSELSGQKAGSVLLFPLYTSSANPNEQNSRISVINANSQQSVYVRVFFISSTGGVFDLLFCLDASETISFLTSDIDPSVTGYILVIAVNAQGCPINHNYLTGEAQVKLKYDTQIYKASLEAEAIAAVATTPVTCGAAVVTLQFDGTSYNRLPRTVAISKLRSPSDNNTGLLILNRLGGSLSGSGLQPIAQIAGTVIRDTGESNEVTYNRPPGTNYVQLVVPLHLTASQSIAAGHTGWLKLWSTDDVGLFGAFINFNSATAINKAAFSGGQNLTKLTLATTNSIAIPVSTPNCPR